MQRLGAPNAALFMTLVPVNTFTIQALRGTTPGPLGLLGAAITLAALIAANATSRVPPGPSGPEPATGPVAFVRAPA